MATRVVYMRPIDQICAQSARDHCPFLTQHIQSNHTIRYFAALYNYYYHYWRVGAGGGGPLHTMVGGRQRPFYLAPGQSRSGLFFCRHTRIFLALSPRTTCLPARDFDGHCTVTAFVFCPFSGAVACRPDYFAGLLFKRLMGSTVLTSYQTEPAVSPPTTRCF